MANGVIFIPKNVVSSNKIMGFRKRNILEGAVETGLWVFLIWNIPFTTPVRWILIIVVGLAIFGVNLIGIKGNPLSSTILNYIKYRKITKQYSYRRISEKHRAKPVFDEQTRQLLVGKAWTPSTGIEAFLEKFKEEQ